MRRGPDSLSDRDIYSKSTFYFRVAQMILCIVCLALALIYWNSGKNLLSATVILFATSLCFLVVTAIDVLASSKHRQYTPPVWVGLAFLAAFMFFLCFGLMISQKIISQKLIAVIFGITGVVFLIDGILIIVNIFHSETPRKVHPIPREKASVDQISQIDEYTSIDRSYQIDEELKSIEELPVEAKKRPLEEAAAPPKRHSSIKSSPKPQFPITSYGGTFPAGGANDSTPLPTPDELTGIEPCCSPNVHRPRRNSQDIVQEAHPSLYPTIDENEPIVSRQVQTDLNSVPPSSNVRTPEEEKLYPIERNPSQTQQPAFQQYEATFQPSGEPQNIHESRTVLEETFQDDITLVPSVCHCCGTRLQEQKPKDPSDLKDPSQTEKTEQRQLEQRKASLSANKPIERKNPTEFQDPMHPRRPTDSRQQTDPESVDPREQIAPFVSHHFNQTPCACGYTHYQSSTVIKGAVRQHPRHTLQQQQRIIREQLEQARNEHMLQGCSCHVSDEPNKRKNVPYTNLVCECGSQTIKNPGIILFSKNYRTDEGEALHADTASAHEASEIHLATRIAPLSSAKPGNDSDILTDRRVIIGTLDIISNSSPQDGKVKRTSIQSIAQRKKHSANTIDLPRRSSMKQTTIDHLNQIPPQRKKRSVSDDTVETGSRSTVEKVNETLAAATSSFHEFSNEPGRKDEDYMKRFLASTPKNDMSRYNHINLDSDILMSFDNSSRNNEENSAIDERSRNSSRRPKDIQEINSSNYELIIKHIAEELSGHSSKPEITSPYQKDQPSPNTIHKRYHYEYERPSHGDPTKLKNFESGEATKGTIGRPTETICRGIPYECFCCPNLRKGTCKSEGDKPSQEDKITQTYNAIDQDPKPYSKQAVENDDRRNENVSEGTQNPAQEPIMREKADLGDTGERALACRDVPREHMKNQQFLSLPFFERSV